jgi:hypothetical protein
MKLEKDFDKHNEIVASNAEAVLLRIQAGHSPDVCTAATMLGVPLDFLERELESQSLHDFVWRCARREERKRRR